MSDERSAAAADAASPRQVAQALRSWRNAGVTHLARSQAPTGVKAATSSAPDTRDLVSIEQPLAPAPAMHRRSELSADSPQIAPAPTAACGLTLESRQARLQALATQVTACTRCRELAATRKQTVFGVGDPQARVLFIGEAPGADEDQQGEPFVGKAGQLLNRIIVACGWRREQIYICNVLRCRPPGNRTPAPEEAANCREYLDGQIAIVDPEYIVCWGSVAAQNLLRTEEAIGRLRGRWFEYGRAKVLCTYHPSYLLRNPSAKRHVWEDMQRLLKAMGLEPPSSGGERPVTSPAAP